MSAEISLIIMIYLSIFQSLNMEKFSVLSYDMVKLINTVRCRWSVRIIVNTVTTSLKRWWALSSAVKETSPCCTSLTHWSALSHQSEFRNQQHCGFSSQIVYLLQNKYLRFVWSVICLSSEKRPWPWTKKKERKKKGITQIKPLSIMRLVVHYARAV